MNIDHVVETIRGVLGAEREAGLVNSLEDLPGHKVRRSTIITLWAQVQDELRQLKTGIDSLPQLPPDEHIAWAQTVAAMPNLRFMEIDTTGLEREDEICRFTLVDGGGQVIEDLFIKPTSRALSAEASKVNGVHPAELSHAPTITEVWDRIGRALHGTYVLSYNQEWDLARLKDAAQRYSLPAITVVGECLQRRCTAYYHQEYYLTLEGLCERIGHPLPERGQQTSIDRAVGQYHLLHAIACAVTDVRPSRSAQTREQHISTSVDLFASDNSLDEGLGDLEDHPF